MNTQKLQGVMKERNLTSIGRHEGEESQGNCLNQIDIQKDHRRKILQINERLTQTGTNIRHNTA